MQIPIIKVSDKGLNGLGLPLLDSLDLSDIPSLVDTGVEAVSLCCPNLRSLNIGWTAVTASGIRKILSNCRRLRTLLLWGCKIGDTLVDVIVSVSPQYLREINVRDSGLTAHGVEDLLQRCTAAGPDLLPSLSEDGKCLVQPNPTVLLNTIYVGHIESRVSERVKSLVRLHGISFIGY